MKNTDDELASKRRQGGSRTRKSQLSCRLGRVGTRALVTLCLPVLLACAGTRIREIERDPSFSYRAIVSHGLAIGGVVSAVADDADSENLLVFCRSASAALQSRLSDHGIPVRGWEEFSDLLGQARTTQSLRAMRDSGSLESELVASIDKAMTSQPDHVVFARIEQNMQSSGTTAMGVIDEDRDQDVTTYFARREMDISFSIYRPSSGDRVLLARLTKQKEELKDIQDPNKGGWAGLLINMAIGAMTRAYELPEVPTSQQVMLAVFEDFAAALREQAEKEPR